jgi:CTP synthase (UTP-ammonia lyase)
MTDFVSGVDTIRVAVVGDRHPKFAAQDDIEVALQHSALFLGASVETRWFDTPSLVNGADDSLRNAHAVWCAPGSPFLSIDGALEGIRFARTAPRPFLGTCAGFQHGVIEFARNVLEIEHAHHAEYGTDSTSDLFIDELLCSLVGQSMKVHLVDEESRALYGRPDAVEKYYCRFGLDESRLPALENAGLRVAGVDTADGTTRIMRMPAHPFFYLTLFVPQTSSTQQVPHPVISGFLQAAIDAKRHTETTRPTQAGAHFFETTTTQLPTADAKVWSPE